MALARAFPDSPVGWWIFLGVAVVYACTRWLLAWHQARRDGDRHPPRAAFADEEPDETKAMMGAGGFRSYRQFFGAVAAAVTVVLVVTLTEDRLRLTLLWTIVPVLVVARAYLDFRRARTARTRA